MRWLASLTTVVLAAGSALADAPAKPPDAKAAPSAAPTGAKPAPAAPASSTAGCKRKVVGRGLDRHVVCELAPIVVKSDAPKPNVVIVPHDGKNVTGRPRSTDPLNGLDRRLR